jgi:hypothetical protein
MMKMICVGVIIRTLLSILIIHLSLFSMAAAYYVSSSGNDSNSGLTSALPWKTLQKITDFTFKAGDNILFKRGNVFTDAQFRINESGSKGSPIIISAYGTGEKPEIRGWGEISGWTNTGNWSEYTTGIWRMAKSLRTYRLWVNGKDKKQAEILTLTTDYPWRWDSSYLYIKSTTNPAITFNSLVDGTYRNRSSDFTVNYITFKNLKITGGTSANIRLLNCNNITIDSCEIGYRGFAGLIIQTTTADSSSNFIVSNCIMSSGDSLMYNYFKNPHTTTEAILLQDGVTNCKIYNNYLYGWSHGGIFIKNITTSYPCHDIEVYNNYVTAPLIDYARGFGCDYASNGYNVSFHNNTIESTSVCTQINGKGLKFYNNVIDNVRDTPYKYTGSPVNSGIYVSAYETPAINMVIYGNVIRNCQDHGIVMNSYSYGVSGNNIHNNNIWNCGSFSIYIYAVTNLTNNIYTRNRFYSSSTTNTAYYSGSKTVPGFNSMSTTNGDVISSNSGTLKFGIYTTTESELKIEHNGTQLAKTISIAQPMVDSKGNKYSNNVTIPPFTSIVLIKDLTAAVAPSAPTSIVATTGNTSALVSFVAPVNNGSSAITGYTVTSIPAGGTDSNAGATSLTHTITGLTNGTSYTFTVKATNLAGTSVASAASNSVTPKAPVATAFTFTGPSTGNVNSASTNFTIIPNNSYTGTITITPTGTGSAGLTAKVFTFSNFSTAQIFSITPTVAGSIVLTPTNSGRLTNAANLTYTANAVVSAAPTSIVSTAGTKSASVPFVVPVNNSGSAITGYTVTSIPTGGTDSNARSTSLTHTITGLTNDTSYTFTVKASNLAGPLVAAIVNNQIQIEGAGWATITAKQSGNVNYNAATDVSKELTVNNFPVGFPQYSDALDFELFPNPVTDFLTVRLFQKSSKITIYNALGSQVYSKLTFASELNIPVSQIGAPGTYFIKVNSGVKKIIVNNKL